MALTATVEDVDFEDWSRAKPPNEQLIAMVKALHGEDKQARFPVSSAKEVTEVLREVRKAADFVNVTARIAYSAIPEDEDINPEAWPEASEAVSAVLIRITDRQIRTRKPKPEEAASAPKPAAPKGK